MTTLRPPGLIVIAMCSIAGAAPAASAQILYVDDDAPPAGDGLTWATAYQSPQEALAVAAGGGVQGTDGVVGEQLTTRPGGAQAVREVPPGSPNHLFFKVFCLSCFSFLLFVFFSRAVTRPPLPFRAFKMCLHGLGSLLV